MTKVKCSYLGNLNCEAIHLQSGSLIRTDAPLDHCGKGESFSPTDLLATSLGTCLLTIMAIKAKSKGFDLKGIYLNIEKVMTQNSERKIKELIIDIFIPESTSNETIDFLKKASKECPVYFLVNQTNQRDHEIYIYSNSAPCINNKKKYFYK